MKLKLTLPLLVFLMLLTVALCTGSQLFLLLSVLILLLFLVAAFFLGNMLISRRVRLEDLRVTVLDLPKENRGTACENGKLSAQLAPASWNVFRFTRK